jgi:hypothetical protein
MTQSAAATSDGNDFVAQVRHHHQKNNTFIATKRKVERASLVLAKIF